MEIKLLNLKLQNFKKYRDFEVNFKDETNIFGANRSGKTSILDAFLWLLFGFDSHDKSDFDIKPKDKDGATIPKIESSVFAEIEIDDRVVNLGRTRKEVWSTVRGSNEQYLKGHTTVYSWNNIDGIKESEFNSNRDSIINKELFKLLTSVSYFFGLKPAIQRNMLMSLIDEIKDKNVIELVGNKTDYLINIITQGSDIEQAKTSLKGKIKGIKDELKNIPVRIDQAEKSKPEAQDWNKLNKELKAIEEQIKNVEAKIIDKSRILSEFNQSRTDERNKLNQEETDLDVMAYELSKDKREKANELEIQLHDLSNENIELGQKLSQAKNKLVYNNDHISYFSDNKEELLKEYKELKARTYTFNELDGVCGNCGKSLDNAEEIKEKQTNIFKENKKKKLSEILEKGKNLASKIEDLQDNNKQLEVVIPEIEKDIKSLELKIEGIKKEVTENNILDPLDNVAYIEAKEQFNKNKETFEGVESPKVDTTELQQQKAELNDKADDIKSLLSTKTTIENIDGQIEALKVKERQMISAQMNLEKDLDSLNEFCLAKTKLLETEVNKKFSFIKFEMFKYNLVGTTEEVCNATFEGVTYHSLNSEAKINAGLDIIKTFSEHHDIKCPVFIDNREGVTNIIDIDTQIINLYVNPEYKQLKID